MIQIIEHIEDVLPAFKISTTGTIELVYVGSENNFNKGLQGSIPSAEFNGQESFLEGVDQVVLELRRLRNPKIRKQLIQRFGYKCSICESDFTDIYGDLCYSIFEVHHLIPIFMGKRFTDKEKVILVCANCHHILHSKGKVPLEAQELRNKVKQLRGSKQ
jgi:predicted HNH restriction endonuclease